MKQCSKCRAPIVWIKTKAGKPIPCDPDVLLASPGGTDRLVTAAGEVVACTVAQVGLFAASTLEGRVSHFATCPDADSFRS